MTWNYRIMHYRDEHPGFGHPFGIHEVYYDDNDSLEGWTEDAIPIVGHDLDDLEWRLQMMLEAFQKPVLEYDPNEPRSGVEEPRQAEDQPSPPKDRSNSMTCQGDARVCPSRFSSPGVSSHPIADVL